MPEKTQIEVFLRILMTLKNDILKNTIFGIRKTSHFKYKGLDLFHNKRCTALDENTTQEAAHTNHVLTAYLHWLLKSLLHIGRVWNVLAHIESLKQNMLYLFSCHACLLGLWDFIFWPDTYCVKLNEIENAIMLSPLYTLVLQAWQERTVRPTLSTTFR